MSEEKNYVEGQHIICPSCSMKSVVKIKHVLKDFKLVESYPICAFCHARLDTLSQKVPSVTSSESARKALDSLFGEDTVEDREQRQTVSNMKEELLRTKTGFCRDCRHYIHHPFLSRCSLLKRPVEPMDDCPRFTPLKKDTTN